MQFFVVFFLFLIGFAISFYMLLANQVSQVLIHRWKKIIIREVLIDIYLNVIVWMWHHAHALEANLKSSFLGLQLRVQSSLLQRNKEPLL